ncbi:Similar to OBP32pep protein gb/U37698 from Arabidopsis thaliana [Arabidopsis thaliana]|uniref:Expressed protein n=2 Tax=Arabidopsis thaliana TaxID=3702 RepID=Q9ZUD4_ARATH|nr:OBP32pep protein, putative (Domain of unknown function DUF220) [Arabidopsis thaliana]AAC98016.1 Similar to OBP32pep protein gb/U37698 from Arabidopsis thaliana [Arabidopsis thaliana]AAY78617.1 unknown [Arabidopsis thaliana]AAZ52691.1 expressed protein [Arabidopsis thaliana]AEE30410.1 OBP32pep protein, putative (Domain of unknown function DUF220) [Arabidopsis thaliana]CAA0236862.1 unnamed protein product [Arabidopsis thaliana]|eukprot:NP_173773.1 OBP32pep protein, putative (Domain of unknown function DUF220) [Arabidopsis thaliana]
MNVFPGFGGWINQNNQQPPKGESKRSENVKSNSNTDMDTNNTEDDEEIKQLNLWSDAEKKHPWYDPPPKVKVTMKKGLCHMNIELTLGVPPDGAYELFINPTNIPFFVIDKSGRQLLANKSRKILKKDGPRQTVKVKKAVAWDFLWFSGSLPINLIVNENKKDLEVKYKKEKMMFMKVFEGSWKIEPLYVDADRLCKNMKPKSREEYKKCSGGQGKIAPKVTMDQYFQPYPLLNLPPFSWYIRNITIKTTKTLLKMLQDRATILREIPYT